VPGWDEWSKWRRISDAQVNTKAARSLGPSGQKNPDDVKFELPGPNSARFRRSERRIAASFLVGLP
jgi:hypothetical protein